MLLSVFPGNQLPSPPFFGFDKVVHIIVYCALIELLLIAEILSVKQKITYKKILLLCGGVILYGGFMELLQKFIVINRSGNWYDFFANFLGVVVGVSFYPVLLKILPLKR